MKSVYTTAKNAQFSMSAPNAPKKSKPTLINSPKISKFPNANLLSTKTITCTSPKIKNIAAIATIKYRIAIHYAEHAKIIKLIIGFAIIAQIIIILFILIRIYLRLLSIMIHSKIIILILFLKNFKKKSKHLKPFRIYQILPV